MGNNTITSINVNEEAGKKPKRVATQTQPNSKQAEKKRDIGPPDDGVPPIGSLEKPKKPKTKKPNKIPLHQIQYTIVDWMKGLPTVLGSDVGGFPQNFRTYYQDSSKNGIGIVEVLNGLASSTSESIIYETLVEAMKSFKGGAASYCLTYKKIEEVVRAYVKEKGPHRLSEVPAIFCWESEKDKIAFNRVIDPAPIKHFYGTFEFEEMAPLYCSIIDRCDQKLAFRQYIGSLLDPDSCHKQTLHIVGSRNAGKTKTMETLLECFFGKRGIAPFEFKGLKDAFLKEEFVNKMAIFADELDDTFYSMPDYKLLTGATQQRVRGLFKAAYNANISAKFIATSNDIPSLPPDEAVMSRIVIIRIGDLKPEKTLPFEDFKKKLLREVPYIIADIRHAYSQLNGKPISVSEESHTESLEIGAASYQVFFDQYFKYSPDSKTLPMSELKRIVVQYGNKISYKQFRQFLIHRYKCVLDYVSPKSVRVATKITAKVVL